VHRSLRIALFPWSIGPLLRWDGTWGRHHFYTESGAGLLYQNLTTRLSESRELFQQGTQFDRIFTGWGSRIATSLGWEWRPSYRAAGSSFGLRLQAFRHDLSELVSEEDGYPLTGMLPFWGFNLSATYGIQTGKTLGGAR
jgi:hypothetical protein